MKPACHFEGFAYAASEIEKFLNASNLFSIVLKNGDIVQFQPKDENAFRQWLGENDIPDIRKEKGWIVE